MKVQSNDFILKGISELESKVLLNDEIQSRLVLKVQSTTYAEKSLRDVEKKVKSKEEAMERLTNLDMYMAGYNFGARWELKTIEYF